MLLRAVPNKRIRHLNTRQFPRRWGAVITIAILLGVMATASYRTAQQSHRDVMVMAERNLPLFDRIQELRARLAAQQSTLYAYYVTADGEVYRRYSQPQMVAVDSLLDTIGNSYPDVPMLDRIRTDVNAMQQISVEFDTVMTTKPVDWDEARRVLAEFSPRAASVDSHSGALTTWVRQHIAERSKQSLERIRLTLGAVTAFGVLGIVAAAVLWRMNARRLVALREQERLSGFPQRNPFPVLALTAAGELSYANEAARKFCAQLFGQDDVLRLLPADLPVWLATARDAVQEGSHQVADRDLHMMLYWFDDFQEYHVYLADITDSKQAERRMRHLAFYDVLTGLPNRSHFNERFSAMHAGRDDFRPTLALLDLDRFQRVVTTAGHGVADQVMCQCADRLRDALNPPGLPVSGELFRFDGNLFCAVLTAAGDPVPILERMRGAMEPVLEVEGREFFLTLSIGVIPDMRATDAAVEELLRKADSAMRSIKAAGGNGIRLYDAVLDDAQLTRASIENGLQHALERGELRLLFQPQLSLHDGRIIGGEALLRWQTTSGEAVSPADFIPIAEDTGLIIPIGEWVISEACRQAVAWRSAWGEELIMAVNISARQLVHGNLAEYIEATLTEFGLAPTLLELEITESAALSDYDAVICVLDRLRSLGVRLSLDDFGTGFSSMGYLQQLPVHKLKVDQSFVRNMTENHGAAAIVRSVITLAQVLDLTVIAEGVETRQQLQLLSEWGCHEIQGYLLGRPMPATDFLELLHRHDVRLWHGALNNVVGQ